MTSELRDISVSLNNENVFIISESASSYLQLKCNPSGSTFCNIDFVDGSVAIPNAASGLLRGVTETGVANYSFTGPSLAPAYLKNIEILDVGGPTDVVNRRYVDTFVNYKISFVNADGTTDKANMDTDTTQIVWGNVNIYTALKYISIGDITIFDYSAGDIRIKTADDAYINNTPLLRQIAGISKSTVATLEDLDVVVDGYVTARYFDIGVTTVELLPFTASPQVDLVGSLGEVIFISPNYPLDYQNSCNGSIVFNAGAGNTVYMEILDLEMEMSFERAWDRCGWETSTDLGVTYNIASFEFMNSTNVETGTWGSDYSTPENRTLSVPGWILTQDIGEMLVLDPTHTGPWVADFTTQFVRCKFVSDSTIQRRGWKIRVYSSGRSFTQPLDTPLYVSSEIPNCVTTDSASNILVGYVADSIMNDGGVWMNVKL
jgi:hypothetical protein